MTIDPSTLVLPAAEYDLRLLTETGNPCFVSADGDGGTASRHADAYEENLLDAAEEHATHARTRLYEPSVTKGELRFLLAKATALLGDVQRVAESRGERLSRLCTAEDDADDSTAAPDNG
ncbi:hypothetical protein [Streptomyces sp. CC228A]|uniref:hypothetical protein n=1 Tax=Streptomyces sp. CC228A TaxID=2898186 RepID=UPI001F35BC29|nr:hypothetical protein [Streptomyces sp. CC228A]